MLLKGLILEYRGNDFMVFEKSLEIDKKVDIVRGC